MQKLLLLVFALALATICWWLLAGGQADPFPVSTARAAGHPDPTANAEPSSDATGARDRTEANADPAPSVPTRLEVLVQLADGTPVGHRAVTVVDSDPRTPFFRHAVTDQRGKARFDVPVQNTRTLAAFLSGGAEAWFEMKAGRSHEARLLLEPRFHVHGKVVDSAGQGVANAELSFLPWAIRKVEGLPRVTVAGHADADGTFFLDLPSGGQLCAQHPRYAPSAMVVVEAPASTDTPHEVSIRLSLLSRPARIKGRVVDPDGNPSRSTAVELRPNAPSPQSEPRSAPPVRLWTDEDGNFVTDRLRPGTIRFEALSTLRACARGTIELTEGSTTELTIRLEPAAEVRGTVRESGGEPVPRAIVQSGHPGDLLATSVECAADGSYHLFPLPAGTARLSAEENPDHLLPGAPARQVHVVLALEPGERASWSPLLAARSGATLHGVLLDEHNRVVPSWTIFANEAGRRARRTVSDDQGRFAFDSSRGGPLDLFVFAPDRPTTSFAAAVRRAVDPARGLVTIRLDRSATPGTIQGRVETADRAPLPADIQCRHEGLDQQVTATARSDGTFLLEHVAIGKVSLTVRCDGYLEQSRELEVLPAGLHDSGNFVLVQGCVVRGSVTSPSGARPANLTISIQTSDKRRFLAGYEAGSYRFGAIPAGRHRLLVQGNGIAAASFDLDVPTDGELVQDIVVVPGKRRTIRVVAKGGTGNWITLALQRENETYTWIAGQARGGGTVEFVAWMAPGYYEAIAWDGADLEGSAYVGFGIGTELPVEIVMTRK